MRESIDLEVLLVLCCLVAVVVFMCFSVGAVNLAAQVGLDRPAEPAPEVDLARLSARRRQLEATVAGLSEEIEKLLAEIAARRAQLATSTAATRPGPSSKDRAEELATLERQVRELQKRIDEVKVELARRKQNAEQRAQTVKDLQAIQAALAVLEKEVAEKRKILAGIPLAVDPAQGQDLADLRTKIEGADKEIKDLKGHLAKTQCPPGAFCIGRQTGSSTLKNPLVVECTQGQVLIQSGEKQRIPIADLERRNPFSPIPGKPDGIAFVIRPDGFEAFRKAFALAEKTRLAIIYYAVDAGLTLEF